MDCELLIQAPPSTIFSLYQDPYHWNILFSGIKQAHLDKHLAAGARGKIEITAAGCWNMRVIQVYDDHRLTIRLTRGIARLYFHLAIDRANQTTCKVQHRLRGNLPASLLTTLFRNSIRQWLRLNLLVVQQQAHKACKDQDRNTTARRKKRSTT